MNHELNIPIFLSTCRHRKHIWPTVWATKASQRPSLSVSQLWCRVMQAKSELLSHPCRAPKPAEGLFMASRKIKRQCMMEWYMMESFTVFFVLLQKHGKGSLYKYSQVHRKKMSSWFSLTICSSVIGLKTKWILMSLISPYTVLYAQESKSLNKAEYCRVGLGGWYWKYLWSFLCGLGLFAFIPYGSQNGLSWKGSSRSYQPPCQG